jgi:hypothetical protein
MPRLPITSSHAPCDHGTLYQIFWDWLDYIANPINTYYAKKSRHPGSSQGKPRHAFGPLATGFWDDGFFGRSWLTMDSFKM